MNLPAILSIGGSAVLALTMTDTAPPTPTGVLADRTLFILNVAGCIGGGFLTLAFVKPSSRKPPTFRQEVIRWSGSAFFGGMFSPFIIANVLPRWGHHPSPETTLACAAFLGMFATAIASMIPKLIELLPRIAAAHYLRTAPRDRNRERYDDYDDEPPTP